MRRSPGGERFLSAKFDCELILVQADPYVEPLDSGAALTLLEDDPSLVPVLITAQRIDSAEASPQVQESTEAALAKGCRIFTQIGTSALTETVTQVTYRAGEAISLGTSSTVTLREARATILRIGAYTKKDTSGKAQRLEGPSGKDAGDLALTYPCAPDVCVFRLQRRRDEQRHRYFERSGHQDHRARRRTHRILRRTGRVRFVVDIDHGNGFVSRLTHLADVQVEMNQRVFQGDPVGTLAADEDGAKPVFHYELLVDGIPYNPLYYFG